MSDPINNIDYAEVLEFDAHGVMNQYSCVALSNARWPGQGTVLGLNYCALKLNGEAGELAEHVGKAMRDEGLIKHDAWPGGGYTVYLGELEPDRRTKIIKEAGDCLWYIAAICKELGISLQDVASVNLHKLYDRDVRKTQRGEGDDR